MNRTIGWLGLSLAIALSACNDDDHNAHNDTHHATPVVAAPSGSGNLSWQVQPYLQAPSTTSMTVMYELEDDAQPATVWVRPAGSQAAFEKITSISDSNDSVYRSSFKDLAANTRYAYYVVSADGSHVSPRYVFKTWPSDPKDLDKIQLISLSDTQLDRPDTLEGVLKNVIDDGVIAHECNGNPEQCADAIQVITVSGDVVQLGGARVDWRQQFFGRMANISPYVPILAVPGNHDYYQDSEVANFKRYFYLPDNGSIGYDELWWHADILNLQIVGLDSWPISGLYGDFNAQTMAVQRQWLKEDLANQARNGNNDYVFAMFHHGCLSEMWLDGESIGSCELVSELENFSADTGRITGHLFGHTHAYSRGQSRDVRHLWLDSASASGYLEPMNDADHQDSNTRDYNTFEISRAEFGYNKLSFTTQGTPEVTLTRRRGGGHPGDQYAVVDQITIGGGVAPAAPQLLPTADVKQVRDLKLAFQPADDQQTFESAQWQISADANMQNDVVNVWGNNTRPHNLFYKNADKVGGDNLSGYAPVDLNADQGPITQLALGQQLDGFTLTTDTDTYYRWHKHRAVQNTHDSTYNTVGDAPPTLDLVPGHTYYFRARLRDTHLNWSPWSQIGQFTVPGQESDNHLGNGNAEAGSVNGWQITDGLMQAITASANGGFSAHGGDYYFVGRGFGGANPGSTPYDAMQQDIDVSDQATAIDNGDINAHLSLFMSTYSGDDQPKARLIALDSQGQPITWPQAKPLTTHAVRTWTAKSTIATVPAGTRALRVMIGGTRNAGSDNDIYFDDIALTLIQ